MEETSGKKIHKPGDMKDETGDGYERQGGRGCHCYNNGETRKQGKDDVARQGWKKQVQREDSDGNERQGGDGKEHSSLLTVVFKPKK